MPPRGSTISSGSSQWPLGPSSRFSCAGLLARGRRTNRGRTAAYLSLRAPSPPCQRAANASVGFLRRASPPVDCLTYMLGLVRFADLVPSVEGVPLYEPGTILVQVHRPASSHLPLLLPARREFFFLPILPCRRLKLGVSGKRSPICLRGRSPMHGVWLRNRLSVPLVPSTAVWLRVALQPVPFVPCPRS